MSEQVSEVRTTGQSSDQGTKSSARGARAQSFAVILAAFGADSAPAKRRGAGLNNQIHHEITKPASVEIHELAAAEMQSARAAGTEGSRDARREADSQRPAGPGHGAQSPRGADEPRGESQVSSQGHTSKDSPGANSRDAVSSKHEGEGAAKGDRAGEYRQTSTSVSNETRGARSRTPAPVAASPGSGTTHEVKSASPATTGRALVGVEGVRSERAVPSRHSSQQMQRPMLRVDQHQLPSQIARALARVMSTGGGSMTLRLNPQSLGDVRVEISIQKGMATALFDAENQSARDLLKSEMHQLRSALERRGVVVERLEVRDAGTARSSESEGAANGSRHEPSEDHESRRGRQEWSPPTAEGMFAETNDDTLAQVQAEPAHGGWTPSVHVDVRAEGTLRLEALA